ncbi:nadh:ubiquinone oxidoreductase subunit [Curvularia clavata]|uniref:Nadh:ubiquinone oxidoreductase subunit n=1 Tax=Curvularia clavata TaxID=95742 RepID=A0A9Q8ZHJ7_CURCL|nr:nadh:ubiquinone oxidoreductase subunit [Curvularia clavata]
MQPTLRRMAGHNHGMIHADPAIIKWANMTVNRHKYFRWTRRTAWITFAYVVLVPGILGTAGYMTEGKWDMRGKRRGDLISEF